MVVVSMSYISSLHVFFLSSAKSMFQTSDKIGQEEEEELEKILQKFLSQLVRCIDSPIEDFWWEEKIKLMLTKIELHVWCRQDVKK